MLKKIYNIYQTILYICGVIFVLGIVVLVAIQIFARYFSISTNWTEELSRYCFLGLTGFGAAAGFGDRTHISVDSFIARAPEGFRKWLAIFVDLVVIALMVCVISWLGTLMVSTKTVRFVSLPTVTVNWAYGIFRGAAVCMIISNILDIVRRFYKPLDDIMTAKKNEGNYEVTIDVD